MAKPKYDLMPGENILLKESCVRHGFWGAYTNELILTTQSIILVRIGLVGVSKGVERFPLSEVRQAIVGEAQNGEKQLEVYTNNSVEDFAFQSGNERTLRTWVMAISDRFSENSDVLDYSYYQSLSTFNDAADKFVFEEAPATNADDTSENAGAFWGDVAKSVLKSGNISASGIAKGIKKASLKQKTSSFGSEIKQSLKDELGITDIQDEFTEIGNEFREAFGLKPKITQREIRERQEQQREQKINAAFSRHVAQAREDAQARHHVAPSEEAQTATTTAKTMSVDEQIEAIKKLKELLDADILTQEEFDRKKKEIMNL